MASERRQSLIINIQNLQNHPQMIEKRRKARQTFESNLILAGLSIEYEQKNVRGHPYTTWSKFWVFLTPLPPSWSLLLNKHYVIQA